MTVMPGSARIIPIRREGFALNGVFATALFVFVEVMLFTGFISAFVIVKNGVTPGMWPPPHQPRLSFERTAINTAALLGSFFYLIVGAHAVHAVAALAVLAVCWWQQRRGRLNDSVFGGAQVFWYFVVLMWPVIWTLVYRS
jgi:heme/copper-type cytochrome/quinol oxidase subunit 3